MLVSFQCTEVRDLSGRVSPGGFPGPVDVAFARCSSAASLVLLWRMSCVIYFNQVVVPFIDVVRDCARVCTEVKESRQSASSLSD